MVVKQVGGTHYQAEYQHWDFVIRVRMGYLEAQATRYLVRYNKKGTPAEDLGKALSYIDKLIENIHICVSPKLPEKWVRGEWRQFLVANVVSPTVSGIVTLLANWETLDDLRDARGRVERLLSTLPPLRGDSNKHAAFEDDSDQERGHS